MFPRDFYEILHILGIALIFSALGGVAVHAANGGVRRTSKTRSLVMTTHGLGSLLILVGGFGMLARLGIVHGAALPGWILGKLVIWFIISVAVILPYRAPSLARPALITLPFLAAAAAYLALYKPI